MKIALVCEYDGTDFVGYQIQDNGRSVQGELNKAVSALYKQDIKVTGSSRTDSGVHALGHVSSLEVPFYIPEDKIPFALNSLLPPDLSVKKAYYVVDDFNARFDSLGKRYIYRLYSAPVRSPMNSRYAHYINFTPDIKRMQEAAAYFAGEHDFKAFCASGGTQTTTVRKLFSVNVFARKNGIIEIEVQGEAFLYNMVRIIAGTLLYVGIGKLNPEDMNMLFTSGDRKLAGKTLPPEGLTLEEVYYNWEEKRVKMGQ